jgi:hypothetical protein
MNGHRQALATARAIRRLVAGEVAEIRRKKGLHSKEHLEHVSLLMRVLAHEKKLGGKP